MIHIPPFYWGIPISIKLEDLGTHWVHLCGLKQQVGPDHLLVTCCPVPRCQMSQAAVHLGATRCCLRLQPHQRLCNICHKSMSPGHGNNAWTKL